MENIIYNELRIRGYSVDVGQVKVRIINDDGKKIRKLLEMDFICNSRRSSRRKASRRRASQVFRAECRARCR